MDRETATSNIRRRRNNISRHSREQTPEPSRAEKLKILDMNDSDVKNGTFLNDVKNQHDEKYVVRGVLNVGPPSPASSSSSSSSLSSSHTSVSGSHAYRAKLMSKKEKSLAAAVHRSQSTNRQENGSQTNVDIFSFMRRDKRSLSAPRYFFRSFLFIAFRIFFISLNPTFIIFVANEKGLLRVEKRQ